MYTNPFQVHYPEEKLDALYVKIEVIFEESDANVAEIAAALLVDHVYYVLKRCKLFTLMEPKKGLESKIRVISYFA